MLNVESWPEASCSNIPLFVLYSWVANSYAPPSQNPSNMSFTAETTYSRLVPNWELVTIVCKSKRIFCKESYKFWD